MHYQTQNGH